MEHIVNISLGISDDDIVKAVIKAVADDLEKEIIADKNEMKESVLKKVGLSENEYGYYQSQKYDKFIDYIANKVVEQYAGQIINEAVDRVTEKIMRKKMIKEKLNEL